MKPLKVLFFSLFYFFTYLVFSLAIDQYFGLQTNFPTITIIGFIFTTLLIVLLVFDVPEKIADTFSRKEERVLFYITENSKNNKDTEKLIETLEENATKTETEKPEEKVVESEIVKKDSEEKEENVY